MSQHTLKSAPQPPPATQATSAFGTTLTQHILSQRSARFTERLASLLTQMGVAAKMIAAQVRRAGIIEVWGETGDMNIQGERVQKLDMIAHHILIEVLSRSNCVAALASEEADDWVKVALDEDAVSGERYFVAFDPLDGSSNIEVSTSIGTIFGIYRLDAPPERAEDLLRAGREMVGAGYVIYGSSTVFVYADRERVDCFTLDPTSGEFLLSRPDLRMPDTLSTVSINEYNEPYWPAWVHDLVGELKARNETERVITGRHIGSLVADFHRNLIKGGVYYYPVDHNNRRGKLRLLYECNPLAFIARAAGGSDSWGAGSVLEITPSALHQRVGFYVGVTEGVEVVERHFVSEAELSDVPESR